MEVKGGGKRTGVTMFQLEDRTRGKKTDVWRVWGGYWISADGQNMGTLLGFVRWYPHWRKYTFEPLPHRMFDSACLEQIAGFCSKVTLLHKKGKRTFEETSV